MLDAQYGLCLLVAGAGKTGVKRFIFPLILTATLGVYFTMLLWSLPKLSDIAGGLKMFDLRPGGYSLTQAQQIVTALGEVGRSFYLGPQHRLDAAYPLLLALTLSMSYAKLFTRNVASALMLLAAVAAGFDLFENMAIAEMLSAQPERLTAEMVEIASLWTLLKSVASSFAFLALLAGLGLAWRRHYSAN